MNAIFDRIAFTTHYFNTPVWCHHRGDLCVNITESRIKTLDRSVETLGRKYIQLHQALHSFQPKQSGERNMVIAPCYHGQTTFTIQLYLYQWLRLWADYLRRELIYIGSLF